MKGNKKHMGIARHIFLFGHILPMHERRQQCLAAERDGYVERFLLDCCYMFRLTGRGRELTGSAYNQNSNNNT